MNRRNDIALVCANFGGIDQPKRLPDHAGIDAFCYTDPQTLAATDPDTVATWTRVIVPDYPRHDFNARLRGRYFKHQIHRLDEVRQHRWLVWTDASIQFLDTRFILDCAKRLADLPPHQRVLLVPHAERRTVRDEYEYISARIADGDEGLKERYAQEKMREQIGYFQERGWNIDARLYYGGFWMVENSDLIKRCWDDWWDQNLRFGMMDQLSLPVMLAQHACEPQPLDVRIWKNPHFHFVFRHAIPL